MPGIKFWASFYRIIPNFFYINNMNENKITIVSAAEDSMTLPIHRCQNITRVRRVDHVLEFYNDDHYVFDWSISYQRKMIFTLSNGKEVTFGDGTVRFGMDPRVGPFREMAEFFVRFNRGEIDTIEYQTFDDDMDI